jgi:LmbE family N-acetylglucosaminyl deacetylase
MDRPTARIRCSAPPVRSHAPPGGQGRGSLRCVVLGTILLLSALSLLPVPGATPLAAQLRAPQASTADLGLLLRQLDGEKRVLMIAAHPDDEDTSLLATLARGHGVRAAYLSLSRGEGGQNLIGPELEEGLGIVRTGELLSARTLDGAEQYFTRAFDFGYSRSQEETFRHWPPEELLRDVVWVVRTFRPHVIISIFTGTARDGHGQHQAAGTMSRQAFEAAGDPARFPEQLRNGVEPWAPKKLYLSTRFRPGDATLEIETGKIDPLLGRSHFQLAMESRSRHRSQDMGAPQTPGPRSTGLELVASRVGGEEGNGGLFAGIDTTLAGLASAAITGEPREILDAVERYRTGVHAAGRELLAARPADVAPHLVQAREALEQALDLARTLAGSPEGRELIQVLEAREGHLADALLAAGSVVVDVRLDRDRAAPGEEVEAQVLVWNGGPLEWSVGELALAIPPGWTATPVRGDEERAGDVFRSFFAMDAGTLAPHHPGPGTPQVVGPGRMLRWSFRIRIPDDAQPSRLYFLQAEREGSLYRWPRDRSLHGLSGNPPLIQGKVGLELGGVSLGSVSRKAAHVDVDKALGEYRVPFMVVPALSVALDRESMAWPADRSAPRTVSVRITNHSTATLEGRVELEAPPGWEVTPRSVPFSVPASGGEVDRPFQIAPTGAPSTAGSVESGGGERVRVRAMAHAGGKGYHEGLRVIDYPHLDPVPFYRDAVLEISRFPIQVASDLRVGYLMGPGDDGLQGLRDLGLEVESLGPEAYREGDLDRYDVIVLGIRAYETREDLLAANDRLLDFARRGGTVVVQYNKYEYPDGDFAPFPVAMRRPHDRVTDPEAPVTLLRPDHPALSRPNRITDADFQGWVQERGLYFLSEWDDRFTPLLEMSDPGLEPNRGSLVVARVGEGAYVYTGLALFRQYPRGVPGAFRLLANLVSLRGADLGEVADGEEPEGEGSVEGSR